MKKIILLPVLLLSFSIICHAQPDAKDTATRCDVFSIGLGLGFDYGGIGVNALAYPQKNIGLFGGVGYAIAGVGYNFGVKLRWPVSKVVAPYIMGMYGYNTAIHVSSNFGFNDQNKIFYGPTAGIGCDFGTHHANASYFTLALTVPFRSPDVDDYITQLTSQGAQFKNKPSPVGISIGYRTAF